MCGLFGVVNYSGGNETVVREMLNSLGVASEVRGTDAGGVAYYDSLKRKLVIKKSKGEFKKLKLGKNKLGSSPVYMGHTRMSTQGSETENSNNHPFPSERGGFALAHNGVLTNDVGLKLKHNLNYTVETDSYITVSMLDNLHKGKINFSSLRDISESVSGTFNFTIIDSANNLWIVRHNNPLYVIDIKDLGLIAYTSTKDIMYQALDDYYFDFMEFLMTRTGDSPFMEEIQTKSGEIIKISPNGEITRELFKPKAFTYERASYNYPTGTVYDYGSYYQNYNTYKEEIDDFMAFQNLERYNYGVIEDDEKLERNNYGVIEDYEKFDFGLQSLFNEDSYVVITYLNSFEDEENALITYEQFKELELFPDNNISIYSDYIGRLESISMSKILSTEIISKEDILNLKESKNDIMSTSDYSCISSARTWLGVPALAHLKDLNALFKNFNEDDKYFINRLINKLLVSCYFGRTQGSEYPKKFLELELFKLTRFIDVEEVVVYLYFLCKPYLDFAKDDGLET